MARKSTILFAFLALQVLLKLAKSSSPRYEELLLTKLLTNYSTTTRPVLNNHEAVSVALEFKLIKIVKLDIKEQQIVVNARITMLWDDPALKWDRNSYNGTRSINIPMSSIWTPDILLYNTASEQSQSHGDVYKANTRVNSSGFVTWMSPVTLRASCEINVKWFPFDQQSCSLNFGSISLTRDKLKLWFYSQLDSVTGVKGKFHYSSGVWSLKTLNTERMEKLYTCCDEPFSLISYKIVLDRLSAYWVLYLVLPCLCLSAISLCSFYIPPETGERIGYCITVVLAMSVYLLVISDKLPEKGDNKPLIGVLYIILFLIMILILISIVFTTHLAFKVTKPPRRLFHLFCKRCYERKKKKQGVHIIRSMKKKPTTAETSLGSEIEGNGSQMDIIQRIGEETSEFSRVPIRRRQTLRQTFSFLTEEDEQEMKYQEQWREISVRLDNIMFWIFFTLAFLSPCLTVGIYAA